MSGTRDTEIAVGCWQPQFNAFTPYGEVHMFRLCLWAEHLRTWEEGFRFPGTLDCTQRIKDMCWHNWEGFKSFPDYAPTAKVFGGKQAMIPEKV